MAYQTYLLTKDTGDIKNAVSNISALATQTKREADDADTEIKALGNQLTHVPSWSKDDKGGAKMINAKAETVAEKPA